MPIWRSLYGITEGTAAHSLHIAIGAYAAASPLSKPSSLNMLVVPPSKILIIPDGTRESRYVVYNAHVFGVPQITLNFGHWRRMLTELKDFERDTVPLITITVLGICSLAVKQHMLS